MWSSCRGLNGSRMMVNETSSIRAPRSCLSVMFVMPAMITCYRVILSALETASRNRHMDSLWNDTEAAQQPGYDGLLYASRLVGADQDLVVWGGGNTSAKLVERDFRGREVRVLRVKGS